MCFVLIENSTFICSQFEFSLSRKQNLYTVQKLENIHKLRHTSYIKNINKRGMVTFQIIFPEIAFSFNMNMGIVHFKLFLKRDMRGIPWVNLEDDATEFVAFLLVVVCCSRRLHGVAP